MDLTPAHWALLASTLAVAVAAAMALRVRGAEASRALRLMLGGGAAIGGALLLLLSLRNDT